MSTFPGPLGTVRRLLRIVSPSCEDMSTLISAMQDGQIPLFTRLRMRVHFLYCCYCRRVREQSAFIRRASALLDEDAAIPESHLTPTDKENLRRALKRTP